jgi:hypothetical protein
MIHPKHPAQNSRPTQVIHRQITAPLILILQERKPSALAGFFVAREVQMHRISVLREDGEDVAFTKLEWQAADVDVGCVAVVCVPGCVGWNAFLELEVVQAGDLSDGLHGCVVLEFHARSVCVDG